MDRKAAKDTAALLATLIGEIMEDHADLALTGGQSEAADWPQMLILAGQDIATLAGAIAILARRAQNPPSVSATDPV